MELGQTVREVFVRESPMWGQPPLRQAQGRPSAVRLMKLDSLVRRDPARTLRLSAQLRHPHEHPNQRLICKGGFRMKLVSLNVARPRLVVYQGKTINTGIFK